MNKWAQTHDGALAGATKRNSECDAFTASANISPKRKSMDGWKIYRNDFRYFLLLLLRVCRLSDNGGSGGGDGNSSWGGGGGGDCCINDEWNEVTKKKSKKKHFVDGCEPRCWTEQIKSRKRYLFFSSSFCVCTLFSMWPTNNQCLVYRLLFVVQWSVRWSRALRIRLFRNEFPELFPF